MGLLHSWLLLLNDSEVASTVNSHIKDGWSKNSPAHEGLGTRNLCGNFGVETSFLSFLEWTESGTPAKVLDLKFTDFLCSNVLSITGSVHGDFSTVTFYFQDAKFFLINILVMILVRTFVVPLKSSQFKCIPFFIYPLCFLFFIY